MLVYEKEREVYKSSGNYIDLTKPSLKNPQKIESSNIHARK